MSTRMGALRTSPAMAPAASDLGERSVPIASRLSGAGEGILLLAALSVLVVSLVPALRETGTPPGWDQAVHLRDSLVYERILRDPLSITREKLGAILRGSEDFPLVTPSGYYPPLVPAITAALYRVAGRSYEVAMSTQLIFLGLLAWGAWGLGTRLAGRPAGLLAALLLLGAPGIRLGAQEYMLDLPLAAAVALAAWALLATDGFSRRGKSLQFGLLAGAGMLIKWSFFLFLAAPVVMVLIEGWRRAAGSRSDRIRHLGNFGFATLLAAAVMAPYYAPIFPILVRKTIVHSGGAADGFTSPFSAESVLYHLRALPRRLLGWPLTLTAAGGILLALRRGSIAPRRRGFLLVWAASLYLLFTFAVVNKQSRYLLPWLTVLVVLAAAGLVAAWRDSSPGWWLGGKSITAVLLLVALGSLSGGWRPESSGDWRLDSLVGRLEQDLSTRPAPDAGAWELGVLPDVREVNGPNLYYYVSRRDLPVTVVQLVNRMKGHVSMEVGLDPFNRGDFYQTFDRYDYLVTKTGANAVSPWEAVVPEMHRYFESRRSEFTKLLDLTEPDGSQVALYRRERNR